MKVTRSTVLWSTLLAMALPAFAAPVAENDLDVIYLADMRPLETNSVQRNQRPGTSVVRAEMDGVLYANSLGLRAARPGPVHATFSLGRKYGRFECRIGLPDNIPTRGRLTFEVEGDGRSLYRSPVLRQGDASLAVEVNVSDVQRLTVRGRALDATDGYLLVWGDAKLVPPGPSEPVDDDRRSIPGPVTPEQAPEGAPERRLPEAGSGSGWGLVVEDVATLAAAVKRALGAAGGAAGPVVLAEFRGIDVPPAATRAFAEELATALIRQGVPLVERGQLEMAMRELKLTPGATLSPATVKQLGRRAAAARIIVGSLTDRGEVVIAHARVLRTDSGAAVAAQRAELHKVR